MIIELLACVVVRVCDDIGYLARRIGLAAFFDPETYSHPYDGRV